jgi:hypothetical protein
MDKAINEYRKIFERLSQYDPAHPEKTPVINESGYAKVANTMRGLVPSIEAVGIFTAQNPEGKPADSKTNQVLNDALEKDLRKKRLGFRMVDGEYGTHEDTFFIPNISRDESVELGAKYRQKEIIWGGKETYIKNGNTYTGMKFELIDTLVNIGHINSERWIFINDNNRDDNYTEVKGRRFYIPYYDEPTNDEGDIIGKSPTVDARWEDGAGIINYNNESMDLAKVNKINELVKSSIRNNLTEHARWSDRGLMGQLIADLKFPRKK